jgi:xanthine dehydrogenase accessory factor
MKEIRDILQAFDQARKEGKRSALATVVHVEGSSYRRPGARMLVTEDGQLTGAISGGCLEGDALRKALLAIHQQQNKLVTYDSTDEDDLPFGIQLGCNGIVHILFEPIDDTKASHPIRLLKELTGERRNAVLVTLFSLDRSLEQPGTILLYVDGIAQGEDTGQTDFIGQAGDITQRDGAPPTALPGRIQEYVSTDVKEAFRQKISCFPEYASGKETYHGFIEFIPLPPALVIAGAGNDVLPLVEITSLLGWHTTIVDGRPHYATARRFGKADKVLVSRPEKVLEQLTTDTQTLFVLMTHNYNYDLALLRELLKKNFPYIGILGPRKKLDRMLRELKDQGCMPDEGQMAAIHSPIGLDIGAETAEEIAVAIAAEIKTVLAGRSGKPLKDKRDSIHNRPAVFSPDE